MQLANADWRPKGEVQMRSFFNVGRLAAVVAGITTLSMGILGGGVLSSSELAGATSVAAGGCPQGAVPGYYLAGSDGGVFAFGAAPYRGSLPGLGVHVNNIVRTRTTPDEGGYWMVASDGGVFAFGDAPYFGSLPQMGIHVNDIVSMSAHVNAAGQADGYWLVASDGGVFAFGRADYHGGLPGLGIKPNLPIIGVVPSAHGSGYLLVGEDGGVFAIGNNAFVGSLPGLGVHVTNIKDLRVFPNGGGYWLVGSDGGVFSFGTNPAFPGGGGFPANGSLPALGVSVNNIVGIDNTATNVFGNSLPGYRLVGSDGGVFAFGCGQFVPNGSLPAIGIHTNNIIGGTSASP
jgi:hypothetical protein